MREEEREEVREGGKEESERAERGGEVREEVGAARGAVLGRPLTRSMSVACWRYGTREAKEMLFTVLGRPLTRSMSVSRLSSSVVGLCSTNPPAPTPPPPLCQGLAGKLRWGAGMSGSCSEPGVSGQPNTGAGRE